MSAATWALLIGIYGYPGFSSVKVIPGFHTEAACNGEAEAAKRRKIDGVAVCIWSAPQKQESASK